MVENDVVVDSDRRGHLSYRFIIIQLSTCGHCRFSTDQHYAIQFIHIH